MVVIISVVLMFVDHHEKHLKGVRSTIGTFVTPLVYLADLPQEFFSWGGESMMSRSQLRQENQALKAESQILKSQLQKFISLQVDNARLRNLLGTQNESLEKRLLAFGLFVP